MTVVKARNSRRLRSGKRSPPCVTSGTEAATASETTPRIPAQETISGEVHGMAGSRSRMRRESNSGRYIAGYTQTKRTTTTAVKTTSAYPTASARP